MAIVGEEFAKYVQDQITKRQKIYGSGTSPETPRTPSEISYLNSKTAWVKFASGVKITQERLQTEGIRSDFQGPPDPYIDERLLAKTLLENFSDNSKIGGLISRYKNKGFPPVPSSGLLPQNYVLFGGTSKLSTSNNLEQRGSNRQNNGNVYSNNEGTYNINANPSPATSAFGLVPMPGIESLDVKYLNRGSIKKATLKIKCYSPEQFKIIDLIYMRLGYTMFLEWGWSPYLNNDGELVHDYNTLIENPTGFFDYTKWEKEGFRPFHEKIETLRKSHSGNYDGMLCKVTNFKWDFAEDGSYDIELSLVSLGDVIESLKTNLLPPQPVLDLIKAANTLIITTTKSQGDPGDPVSDYLTALIQIQRAYVFAGRDNSNTDIMDSKQVPHTVKQLSVPLDSINSIWVVPLDAGTLLRGAGGQSGGSGLFDELGSDLNQAIGRGSSYDIVHDDSKLSNLVTLCNKLYPGWRNSVREYGGPGSADGSADTDLGLAATLDQMALEKRIGTWIAFFDPVFPRSNSAYVKIIPDPSKFTFLEKQVNKGNVFYINYNNKTTDEDMVNEMGFYFRFGYILKFLQDYVIPLVKSDDGDHKPTVKLNLNRESNKMYVLPYQTSLDPRICLVNTPSWEPIGKGDSQKRFSQNANTWKYSDGGDEMYGSTLDIYLNGQFLLSKLNNSKDEKGNVDLYSFLDGICQGINKAMGGINNIEPIINEDTNEIVLIDGSYQPDFNKPKYKLELYGYNPNNNESNFVKKLDLKTEITNDFASMVSIGATSGGYTKGMENTMFSKWNDGVIDIWKEKLIPADTYKQDKQEESVSETYLKNFFLEDYKAFGVTPPLDIADDSGVGIFGGHGDASALDENSIENNLSVVSEYYRHVHALLYNISQKTYSSPSNGFVPISLGLTIDGIGGIKIYNTLRTNTSFLPKRYPDNLNFIIKNVNHSIKEGDWLTTLKTVVIANSRKENGKNIFSYKQIKTLIDEDLSNNPSYEAAVAAASTINFNTNPGLADSPSNGTPPPDGKQPDNWPYYVEEGSSSVPKNIEDEKYSGKGTTYPKRANPPSNNKRISANSSIKTKYIPRLNKINGNKGLKILALAMAIREGFYPNTRSYKTNNPGNIGNTDAGGNNNFKDLTAGIQAQMNYLKRVSSGQHRAYPLNKTRTIKPYFSPEIAKNSKNYQLTPYLPGYKFKYTGKLSQFIKIYSTGARAGNAYISDIISLYKKNGISVNSDTTLKELISFRGSGNIKI